MWTTDELAVWAGKVQRRAASIDAVDSQKRELYVKAAPYGVETDIGGGIDEEFLPGTFAKAAAAPDRLLVWHDHGGPMVGRGTEVEDKSDGIWIRSRLASTTAAQEMVTLIEEKFLTDVSVEFLPMPAWMNVEQRGARMKVAHRRAHLLGYAIVPEGAYADESLIASLRDEERDRKAEELRAWFVEFKHRQHR